MIQTTFFTSANRRYELFVLPYIASILVHNDDARVEVCLEDSRRFRQDSEEALAALEDGFGRGRFHLRDSRNTSQMSSVSPNSVRFLEAPEVMTTFTYIGDIDILCLESVADKHLRRMEHTGRPYSNVLRPGKPALSGLHFTRSDVFYPQRIPADADFAQDEHLLYELVVAQGLDLPAPDDRWRPVHGYHLSLNRAPRISPGWDVAGGLQRPIWHPRRWARTMARRTTGRSVFNLRQRFNAYRKLRRHPLWRSMVPRFDPRYARLLGLLDLAVAEVAQEHRLGAFVPEYARRFLLEDRSLVQAIARDFG